MTCSGENTMCLPAFDETVTSTPTDVDEIALQERRDELEWEHWWEVALQEAVVA
jgi:hypothetical protein